MNSPRKIIGAAHALFTRLTVCYSALETEQLIVIGPEDGQSTFKIQKQLLLDASRYFVRALSGDFREASERRIRLPGTDLETTKLFVYWLCRKDLPKFARDLDAHQQEDQPVDPEETLRRYIPLIHLWILGDKLIIPDLQNDAMEEMLKVTERVGVPYKVFQEGLLAAPSNSKLQELLIAEARLEYFHGDGLGGKLDELAKMPGFMADFVRTMGEEGSTKSACEMPAATFMVTTETKII